jgi:hypothetical protein
MMKLIFTEGVSNFEKSYLRYICYTYLQIIAFYVKYNGLKA